MPRDERHTKSIPYGTLGIIPLKSCEEMGKKVDECLVRWRSAREDNPQVFETEGYRRDSYIIDAQTPRFGSGEGKGEILESVRAAEEANAAKDTE